MSRLYDFNFHQNKAEAFKRGNQEKIEKELKNCTFTPDLKNSNMFFISICYIIHKILLECLKRKILLRKAMRNLLED